MANDDNHILGKFKKLFTSSAVKLVTWSHELNMVLSKCTIFVYPINPISKLISKVKK